VNFLAHLYLAGESDHHRLGGLMGDFVKGPLPGTLPADLAEGVLLHRRIDSYADRHPAFQRSRARMSVERRRYGGILVDMFYDHFLARLWTQFHPQPLPDYVRGAYWLLQKNEARLPAEMVQVARAMAAGDWLSSYAKTDAIAVAVDRMALRRLRMPNTLAGGVVELLGDYAGFEADFVEFITDARLFCNEFLAGIGASLRTGSDSQSPIR